MDAIDPPTPRHFVSEDSLLAGVTLHTQGRKKQKGGISMAKRQKTKKKWIAEIQAACQELGVYKDAFAPTVEMLADVLIQREKTWNEFQESGGTTMIPYTNKNGSTNLVKNPLLIMWNELTKTALSYRRELGLTPAGLKKLDEKALKQKRKSALATALSDLG